MIPVTVTNIFLSNVGFVVFLKSRQDERSLPIFIGVSEAQAIAMHINKVQSPRPMTHDLLKKFLELVECRLDHVEVTDLQDGTFYSTIVVRFEGQTLAVDARPSDAIAMALRCNAPIGVAEHVMKTAGTVIQDGGESASAGGSAPPAEEPDAIRDLEKQLQLAIQEERYEDAARLRDQLRRALHLA